MKALGLADHQSMAIQRAAIGILEGATSNRERLERIFLFVRDEIAFGFPPHGDLSSAEETLRLGYGQCNTKGALFLALCRAAGIDAAIHFSSIDKNIQRGLFPRWALRLLPAQLSHSWIDVKLDGEWRRLDSYINDSTYYENAKCILADRGWEAGYSVSCAKGSSSIDFSLDTENFVQMGSVVSDIGRYKNPEDFYETSSYTNRPGRFKQILYLALLPAINRRIHKIRTNAR